MKCRFEGEVAVETPQFVMATHNTGRTAPASEQSVLEVAIRAVQIYAERHPRPTARHYDASWRDAFDEPSNSE